MISKEFELPFVLLLALVVALVSCQVGITSEEMATEIQETPQEGAKAEEEAMAESEEATQGEEMEVEAGEPLIVLLDNDEGPITPANFNTFIGYWLVGYVYDSLFARAPDLSIVPALATEATPSEDGLTWNVKLRDDVTWHDGEPFTAEDVIFSYDFLKAAGRAPNLAAVDKVEAQGDYELTISLSTPAPFFLSEGLAGYYILPEHIWRDQEPVSGELSQFQGKIGTGAYLLEEVVPGESYTFKANPNYFLGEPLVDTIIAKIVKDRTQQFNQLRTEAADAVLSSVPPAQVEQLKDIEDITLAKGSDFFNYVFYMNGSRPPFDQVEVRQAIAKAIDTRSLVDIVFLGEGVELPLSWYHPDLPWAANIAHQYDPDGSMKLLETAGLVDSDGDGIREFEGEPTSYEVLCDVNNPVEIRATELIVGWLEDVGIGASLNCLDIDTAVTQIWPNFVAVPDPDYDMAIWGWSSGVQFQRGFLRGLLDSDFGGVGWANLTGQTDPELDELIAEYVSNPNPDRTEELALQVQERIAENLPFIALMSPSGNFGYRPSEYDGWIYMKGTGIAPVWSYFPEGAQ